MANESSSVDSNKTDSPKAVAKTPFINASSAYDAYDESQKWLRPYFDPLTEFERIARNKPSDRIDPSLPRITDGTMAAIVQEQPKRIIQQLATGLVECKDYPEYAAIADLVLRNRLLPMYNRMGDALQKHWNMLGKAMTYGSSASYTFFTSTNGIFHTDFTIPYRKDIISEKGKVYAPDSNIGFMRSWYQKRDLQAIINKEKALMAKDPKYVSDWDLKELALFMEAGASAKPADLQTPAEKEKGGDNGGYEVIHAFQKGIGAEMYSFSPRYEQGKTLRSRINKDPRGNMPLDFLYCNIDLSNPIGRGQIELSGGIQNLIDQQMQMFQFQTTLAMGPPLQVWGNVNKASLKFRPNAIWDMGTNENNRVEPYDVNNPAIQNFTNNMQFLQSKIFQLNSTQDNSIGASNGNAGQSKTQAGVQAAESRLGVSDNYLRKQFEAWDGAQSETSINIMFSEMTGKQTMKLEGKDLKEIQKTPAAQYLDENNILTIPYKEISDTVFRFHVDASSSEVKEDAENADKLTEVLKVIQAIPDTSIQQALPKVVKLIVDEIGAEGTDDLFPTETDEQGNPIQQQPQGPDPQMIQQMVQQAVQEAMAQKPQEDPMLKIFKDLPEDAKRQLLSNYGLQPQESSPIQQNLDIQAAKIGLDATNAQHSQEMDVYNAAYTASQPTPTDPNSPEVIKAKADAAAQNKAAESGSSTTSKKSLQHVENPQPQQPQDDGMAALSPEEEQVVHALFQRGFTENDAEQAITMLRQGVPEQKIIQALGAKYAQQ